MNLLGFNPYAFIETLPYMGKGMLGIFIVIGIIKEQNHQVFMKAIKICLECIGLG